MIFSHTLIISDLHLSEDRPKTFDLFQAFMESMTPKAEALYILGDFFDYWVGDDLISDFHESVIHLLSKYSKKGLKIFILPGNRDFLLGADFCAKAGATLLEDPTLVHFDGQSCLLTHGDLLCTDDRSYQRYRAFVQHPWVKRLVLSLPGWIRSKLAHSLRQHSQNKQRNRPWIDVSNTTVSQWMSLYQTPCLIHGHTHEFATHPVSKGSRIVLGDWSPEKGSFVFINRQGHATLEPFFPVRKPT